MPPVSDYREIFSTRGPQLGRPTALAISPSARWFSSATDSGDFGIFSTYKDVSFHIDMGPLHYVTAIVWPNDQQLILACVHKIEISKLFSVNSLTLTLAYDPDGSRLAVGRPHSVCVWQREEGSGWAQIGDFHVDLDGSLPLVEYLHFFGLNCELFVGTTAGPMIWGRKGTVVLLDVNPPVHIGATAFAANDSIMAVTTLDAAVIIWPVSRESPLTFLPHKFQLKAAEESSAFEPHYPVAVTAERHIICGTTDGSIVVLSHNAKRLQTLTRHAHCTRLISSSPHIFVAAFTDAVGVVTHTGYTSNEDIYNYHIEKRAQHSEEGTYSHFYKFNELYKQRARAGLVRASGTKCCCLCQCMSTAIIVIIVFVVISVINSAGNIMSPVETYAPHLM
ncbi:hypothetical protein FRC07_010896 [Ceratobasidium sp. 392]|nr:hypothetical protein FRC07_010896 [Ceratobasidium sp. 392]